MHQVLLAKGDAWGVFSPPLHAGRLTEPVASAAPCLVISKADIRSWVKATVREKAGALIKKEGAAVPC